MKADMTGRVVKVVDMTEASALGAAICAGAAVGGIDLVESYRPSKDGNSRSRFTTQAQLN